MRLTATWPVALALGAMVAGCTLPRTSPSPREVAHAVRDNEVSIAEASAADAGHSRDPDTIALGATWQLPPAITAQLGTGDVLSVTVYERDGLGMFPSGPDGPARFDNLVVDGAGTIQVPYLGTIPVAGLTPPAVRAAIVKRLAHVSIGADASVALVERHSQVVTVQGDVVHSGNFPLQPDVQRLSSVLALAGPTPTNLEISTLTVRRGPASTTLRLSDVYGNPANDIALRGGDVLIVRNTTAAVTVLGAVGLQGRLHIPKRNYSVIDAVSDARGLNDSLANPASVYLLQLSRYQAEPGSQPHIVHFDFRDPAQLAIASIYALHDGDTLLISNAPFAQTHKILSAFGAVLNTARSAYIVAP